MLKSVKLFLVVICVVMAVAPALEAGRRRVPLSRRTVNSYSRDVSRYQRQTSRTVNQIQRDYSRAVRRTPVPVRRYYSAPPSSGVYFGGYGSGVYIRF